MNSNIFRALLILSISFLYIQGDALADNSQAKPKKTRTKVAMKCHVEFRNGELAIHQMVVGKKKAKNLEESLLGRKIRTAGVKGKHEVVKVNQCVRKESSFKTAQMNDLERKTAW